MNCWILIVEIAVPCTVLIIGNLPAAEFSPSA